MDSHKIVVEVPRNLKPLAEAFEEVLSKVQSAMKIGRGGSAVAYDGVESDLQKASAAVERAAHATMLRSLDIDAPRISIRGKTYNRIGRSEGVYYSTAGSVRIERMMYRAVGRGGKVIDPIALRIGAVADRWLPKTARAIAHLMQQGTAREAENTSKEIGRLPYCASSFERVGHQVGRLFREHHADIEDLIIEEHQIFEQAVAVSISLDRVSVPMEEERKRPRGRPRRNAPKRWVTRQFRMAWCGTVTIHDEKGDSLDTTRYGAMPGEDPDLLCGRMAVNTLKVIEKHGGLKVQLLADGAHEMWNLLESHFPENVFGKTVSLVDYWHAIEKLASAAKTIYGDEQGRQTTHEWKGRLKGSSTAIDEIVAVLSDSGKADVAVGDSRPVHEAITYLTNHRDRMDYAAARRAELPIGSGSVEATCKSLFAMRLKRAGSRWHQDTGEDIVQLRALALSDRWNGAMSRLMATQRTAVRVRAA